MKQVLVTNKFQWKARQSKPNFACFGPLQVVDYGVPFQHLVQTHVQSAQSSDNLLHSKMDELNNNHTHGSYCLSLRHLAPETSYLFSKILSILDLSTYLHNSCGNLEAYHTPFQLMSVGDTDTCTCKQYTRIHKVINLQTFKHTALKSTYSCFCT